MKLVPVLGNIGTVSYDRIDFIGQQSYSTNDSKKAAGRAYEDRKLSHNKYSDQ